MYTLDARDCGFGVPLNARGLTCTAHCPFNRIIAAAPLSVYRSCVLRSLGFCVKNIHGCYIWSVMLYKSAQRLLEWNIICFFYKMCWSRTELKERDFRVHRVCCAPDFERIPFAVAMSLWLRTIQAPTLTYTCMALNAPPSQVLLRWRLSAECQMSLLVFTRNLWRRIPHPHSKFCMMDGWTAHELPYDTIQ